MKRRSTGIDTLRPVVPPERETIWADTVGLSKGNYIAK